MKLFVILVLHRARTLQRRRFETCLKFRPWIKANCPIRTRRV